MSLMLLAMEGHGFCPSGKLAVFSGGLYIFEEEAVAFLQQNRNKN